MAAYFLDSSALVKRYAAETGTAWVRGLTTPAAANDISLVRITGVEVVSALVRHVPPLAPALLMGALTDFSNDFQHQYRLSEVGESVVQEALRFARVYRLSGYDAVQLAGALDLLGVLGTRSSGLTFISADSLLNAAAAAEGLAVDDPNLHP